MVNNSTFFGPVACLAAALGPLAAELGPLACFKSYWFLFIIINSVLCVFRFINLWWLISSCVKYESKNITKANWMFSDYVFPLNILLVYKRKKTLFLTEYLSVTKKWSHNWLFFKINSIAIISCQSGRRHTYVCCVHIYDVIISCQRERNLTHGYDNKLKLNSIYFYSVELALKRKEILSFVPRIFRGNYYYLF